MTQPTHVPKQITRPDGTTRTVYVRTAETSAAIEHLRLGSLAVLKPYEPEVLRDHWALSQLVVQTSVDAARRIILARVQRDKRSFKHITGTQVVRDYLANESYFDGYPQFRQLFILFGYQEAANRRLAEFINELVMNRHHLGEHCWLFVPKPIPDLAAQWGDSLLNLRFLPHALIPPDPEIQAGPVSVAKPDFGPRPDPRVSYTPTTPPPVVQEDGESAPYLDPKMAGKKKKWKGRD